MKTDKDCQIAEDCEDCDFYDEDIEEEVNRCRYDLSEGNKVTYDNYRYGQLYDKK